MMDPIWLGWARELQAIAQNGLTFTQDAYDRERFEAVRAVAARMIATQSGADFMRLEQLFAEQTGYATPRVDVRGAIFRENRILLVRERSDQLWSLPGGWADVNQAPTEAVIREVREEAGLEIAVRKLAAVYDRNRHPHPPRFPFHVYKLFFIGEITGGAAAPGVETSAVGFFDEDALPDLSIGRVLDYQIRRMFDHWREPTLPTEFD